MYTLKPYVKNCNASVALIATFLVCSSVSSAINTAYSDAELNTSVKNLVALLTMAYSLALSSFVIKGLNDTKKQSLDLHEKFKILALKKGKPNLLEDEEKAKGTLSSTLFLSHSSMGLSGLACIINIIAAGTTIQFNQNSNIKYMNPGWLLTILSITNFSNLIGFVLLNILGIRNTNMLQVKHGIELSLEKDKIEALEDEKRALLSPFSPLASPPQVEAGGTALRRESTSLSSPEKVNPFLEAREEEERSSHEKPKPPTHNN